MAVERETTYRIRNWSQHFENNRTRELKYMTWMLLPNKQDGDGYTELLDHPRGAEHFGCWVAILQVASKCDPRGTLVRDGGSAGARPHDAASLARITRIPVKVLAQAINRLLDIGWLEAIYQETQMVIGTSQEGAVLPQEGAGLGSQEGAAGPQDDASLRARGIELRNGTERKGTERNHDQHMSRSSPLRDAGDGVVPDQVQGRVTSPQVTQVWRRHIKARIKYFTAKNGAPPPHEPDLTPEYQRAIREAIKRHGFDKARAAGVGIFLSAFHTGEELDPATQQPRGKEFLAPEVCWRMTRSVDNVERFSALYFQAKVDKGHRGDEA